MFDFSQWLVAGIIDGYKKGYIHFSKTTELTVAYLSKGFITEAQVQEIVEACPMPTEDYNENEKL